MGLPAPGDAMDGWGGWSLRVDQVSWGHVARKPTLLYLVRVPWASVQPRSGGTVTHWCSPPLKRPGHIRACSAQQRQRTPVAFAEWLVALARGAA
jgi:hypothetical protein